MATTEMALRTKLVEARIGASMTQAQVADHMGCPQSRISKLETGEMRRASFRDVVRLSGIYRVSLVDLAEAVR